MERRLQNPCAMAHSDTTRSTALNTLTEDAAWPGIAAAAVAWWDEARAEPPVGGRPARSSGTETADAPSWPSIAAAAVAWWDDAAHLLPTRSVVDVAPANDVQSPAWPEVAAAAGAWWDDALASGVFAKTTPRNKTAAA